MKKYLLLTFIAVFLVGCSDDSNESTTTNPTPNTTVNPLEFTISTDYIDLRLMKVILGKNKSGISVNTNPTHSAMNVGTLKINLEDYILDNIEEVYITTKDQGNQTPLGKIRTIGIPTGTNEFSFDGTETIQIIIPLNIPQ